MIGCISVCHPPHDPQHKDYIISLFKHLLLKVPYNVQTEVDMLVNFSHHDSRAIPLIVRKWTLVKII